ncbi:MAG: PAS domain S-box protein, partial [Ignavibacteriota bacterium]
ITKRKQIQEKLEFSEDQFHKLYDNAKIGLYRTTREGTILMANKELVKMLGYPSFGALASRNIEKGGFGPSYSRKDFIEMIEKHSQVINFESAWTRLDGTVFFVRENAQAIRDSNNNILYFDGVVEDITERKLAEEEIIMLAHSLKSINECVSITDLEDKILFVNESFLKTYGYEENELIGKQITIIRSLNNPPEIVKEILPATVQGEWKGELLNIRKDGSEFPVHLSTTLINDKEGKPLRLIGVASDITAQKQMLDDILKLSSAVEQSPVSIIITDIKGNIEYVNPKGIETTGYQFSELQGKNPRIFKTGEKSANDYKVLWDTISSRKEWHGEFQNKKKNGELYWESASISAIVNNTGEIIHYLAVKEDITEQKKINEELINSKEKAEEMSRLKSNFLANMSHELRTPLVGILGFAEIIRQEIVSPEIKVMAETICKSGNRLSETLNLILDLSQLETEKKEIKFQKVELVVITKEVITLFKVTAQEKGLSLISSFSSESIFINFDARAYYSILNNLINNAIKFTSEGSITTSVSQYDDSVEISVTDTGIGIAKNDYQSIFEEFRQVSEGYSRNFEGSGLGLSITKKLVEKYGGTITVESEVGKGSTFKVILPVTNALEILKEPTASEKLTSTKYPETKLGKPLGLLVDDDPLVFQVMKRYLRDYVELETTMDAEFAAKLLRKKKYDIIFMDINLNRGMDGKEAATIIRKIDGYEFTPIIATTAYALAGDREKFISAGCSHYLSKPFTKTEIIDVVSEALKQK